jgi:protein involved in polysaccharide export with SLBB domain
MMKKRILLLMCVGFAMHLARAAETTETNRPVLAEAARSMTSLDDRQKLGPGDRVTYRVIEDQDEMRSLTIADTGELEVPYFGLVPAAGKTSRQLAQEIKTLLERELYHQATVIIAVELVNKTRTTGKVYVTGQVRNKGGLEIPAGENLTVSKAILNAGGFSDFSDKRRVRLIRKTGGGTQTMVINVLEIWEKGDLKKDVVVQADDLIVVPERLVNW